jgi:hypothetical protein
MGGKHPHLMIPRVDDKNSAATNAEHQVIRPGRFVGKGGIAETSFEGEGVKSASKKEVVSCRL